MAEPKYVMVYDDRRDLDCGELHAKEYDTLEQALADVPGRTDEYRDRPRIFRMADEVPVPDKVTVTAVLEPARADAPPAADTLAGPPGGVGDLQGVSVIEQSP